MRTVFSFTLLLALLSGCDIYGRVGIDDTNIPGTLPELLVGECVFPATGVPSERYIISETTLQYIDSAGGGSFSFKGRIVFVSNFSSTSGVIIIRYIEYPDFPGHNGNSYFGIYYRNLGRYSVQLANAAEITDNFSAPDTATLEEAIGKFTRGQMGRYVDWGAVQPQRRVQQ